jgi:ABC-type lipoprotein release transport system permease subunit
VARRAPGRQVVVPAVAYGAISLKREGNLIPETLRAQTVTPNFLGSALLTMTVGIVIGLIGAWGLAELVRRVLFEMQPRDPLVFAGASLVLALAGLIAAFGPARRASSVDPIQALKTE